MPISVRHAHQQILAGSAATLTWQPVDADGEPAAPDGTVTIGIVRADGTVLVAPGAATVGAANAARTYALTGAQTTTLDLMTATWTDSGGGTAVTQIEIVGGYYFRAAEARTKDTSLADTSTYPNTAIIEARREVEDEFEEIAGVAFVPRYRRGRYDGTGTPRLALSTPQVRTVRTITVGVDSTSSTVFTAAELAAIDVDGSGVIERLDGGVWPSGCRNILIEWEHGWDRPPADVKTAAIRRTRQRLNQFRSSIPDGAERWTTPEGTIVFATIPGRGRIGDPEIDAVLQRHSQAAPTFA